MFCTCTTFLYMYSSNKFIFPIHNMLMNNDVCRFCFVWQVGDVSGAIKQNTKHRWLMSNTSVKTNILLTRKSMMQYTISKPWIQIKEIIRGLCNLIHLVTCFQQSTSTLTAWWGDMKPHTACVPLWYNLL